MLSGLVQYVVMSYVDCGNDGQVVVCLPRPMEGMGDSNFQIYLQNCQFHHRRMESLEHFNVSKKI